MTFETICNSKQFLCGDDVSTLTLWTLTIQYINKDGDNTVWDVPNYDMDNTEGRAWCRLTADKITPLINPVATMADYKAIYDMLNTFYVGRSNRVASQ